LRPSTFGTGGAGRIDLRGGTAVVTDRASISAASYGQSADAGFANDIRISVERLSLAQGSQISNATHGAGAAGQLAIDAESVRLESGSSLQASSLSVGSAAGRVGDLFIDADQVVVDAASIQARSIGNAAPGTIAVRSGTIALTNGAVISAVSDGAGDAGDIALSATDSLDIAGFSQISTEASEAAGGNIALLADRLRMQSGLASTSVRGGPRDSGNVLMDSELLLLDNSAITARAVDGDGGRIDIAATFMLRSASTLIDASSQLGIDGEIGIAGFDVDLNADIAPLPADFLNAKAWLAQPCTARLGTDVSRLTLAGRAGAYRDSGDYFASPLSFEVATTLGTTPQIATAFARLGGPCR
jgi:hypothetical protein